MLVRFNVFLFQKNKIMKIIFEKRSKKDKNNEGFIPGVLYGSGVENTLISINLKEFNKIFEEAAESTLISLESKEEKNKHSVLIHDVQRHPVTGNPIHVDFFQPNLKEEVEVTVELVFEGIPPAVKELGGTLVKNLSEVEIKALPTNLPSEIIINVESLKTFDDTITIADIKIGEGVKILADPEEIIALVTPIEDIEEELKEPIKEDVSLVEKQVKQKKKEEEEEEK